MWASVTPPLPCPVSGVGSVCLGRERGKLSFGFAGVPVVLLPAQACRALPAGKPAPGQTWSFASGFPDTSAEFQIFVL